MKKEALALLFWTRQHWRDRFSGSSLGVAWAFLGPALQFLILGFVFNSVFAPRVSEGVSYFVWVLTGFPTWLFFSQTLEDGVWVYLRRTQLIRYSSFEKKYFAVSCVLNHWIVYLTLNLVILLWLNFSGSIVPQNGMEILLKGIEVVVFSIFQFLFMVGLVQIVATLTVFLRDLQSLVPLCIQTLMWITPIFWRPTGTSGFFEKIVEWNPMTHFTRIGRASLLERPSLLKILEVSNIEPLFVQSLFILLLWTGASLILGYWIFRRLEKHFADTI